MLALHARFARRVELGIKTIETRTWPWPYPPGWLVICASKALGGVPLDPPGVTVPDEECPLQALTCLVWIAGSRPLLPEDERAACFYAEGRFAWPISKLHRFPRPVPLAELGLTRAPQKFQHLDRAVVVRALGAATN
jgi:hypothetical protein